MKVKTSPLAFIDFYTIVANLNFIRPADDNINVDKLFKTYDIDIDFSLKIEKKNNLLVFIRVQINDEDLPKEGYQIMVEGVAIFDIKNIKQLGPKIKSNLMYFSSLSIAINNMRNYISILTSSSPLGKYVLPAIDVNDLHKQKQARLKKRK